MLPKGTWACARGHLGNDQSPATMPSALYNGRLPSLLWGEVIRPCLKPAELGLGFWWDGQQWTGMEVTGPDLDAATGHDRIQLFRMEPSFFPPSRQSCLGQ